MRLEAIGPNGDVTLNASIISGSGNVVIISDRDVIQNNDGNIQTSSADVLIDAERNWTMTVDAEIESSNGAIGGLTHTGEMAIGRLTATTVMLNSAKSVSDANGTRLNVIATASALSQANRSAIQTMRARHLQLWQMPSTPT